MAATGGPSAWESGLELGWGLIRYPALDAAQWWTSEAIRARQWRRLQRTLRQAHARSPLYRERFRQLGITPADIRSLEDLRRLPPTRREDLRQPQGLLAEGLASQRLRSTLTSGSTGRRTTSYFDERAWVLAKYLLKLRARRACGLQPWHRVALFQEGAPESPRLAPWTRVQGFSIHRPIEEVLPAARQFGAHAFYGFPGYLARLGEAARGTLRPRLVFTSGELLDPATRRAIERGLGAPVLDVYGCTEVKEIAWECPEQAGHHLNADWVLVETDPPDGAGRLLVTPLYNRAMPLLRYEVGDTGTLLDRPCPCGRGLPLIRPTLGRSVDYLALPDGRVVAPYSLTCAIEAVEGMRQYQLVQTEPDLIELRIVPDRGFDDASRAALHQALAPVLPGVRVRLDLVPEIRPEPSGKYRIVQSRLGAARSEAVLP
jgi:phenylacetate-CoA ligase